MPFANKRHAPPTLPSTRALTPLTPARTMYVRSLEWGLLIAAMCISGVLVYVVDNDYRVLIGGLALVCLMPAAVVRGDIVHPYVWYLPLYFLYSAALPIVVSMGELSDRSAIPDVVRVEWAAACAFIVIVGPLRRPLRLAPQSIADLELPSWFLYVVSLVMTVIFVVGIWTSTLISKYELATSVEAFVRLDPFFSILALAYGTVLATAFVRRKIPWVLIAFTLGWNLFALGISGERDYLLRVVWITIFLAHVLYRRFATTPLLIAATCSLIVIPIMGDMKNVLLSGEVSGVQVNSSVTRVLGDEFITASDNLRLLIDNPPWEPLHGETLIWDVHQTLLSGTLFRTAEGVSPQQKFNEIFFPSVVAKGGGRGFTLVGEGYVNFGLPGAVLWYLLLGGLVSYVYRRASTSIPWMVGYVVAMPLVVYVTRADFSNLMSQSLKHIALPLALIYVLQFIPKTIKKLLPAANSGRKRALWRRQSGDLGSAKSGLNKATLSGKRVIDGR